MMVIMKEIEVIAWFVNEKDKHPRPLRLRLHDEHSGNIVIKVDHILFSEDEGLAGSRMILYRCQSTINNVQRIFEIKYELRTCKWYLYKW